ncbi:FlgD immunoglobulin-like domain containing protein [Blastopirellula marina]|uniref:FlgD/Vpr Ig-like domain-containing protein n=1 Tax=Blastopirellula marina DSM 3645 TaxID=314230 RepID=A3ZPL9_9BACT|nr:FlgD immunoglobulin-like domain containing protein [Blastopirellula marina]EAQ81697.1 hypothetical protein DSM3645_28987 [Blastopirellula marina DSM 3645]
MNRTKFSLLLFVVCCTPSLYAEDLRVVGVLGNSGEAGPELAQFADHAIYGLGVVQDEQGGLWERAGDGRLAHYSLDGRLLGQFDLPRTNSREDVLALSGDRLVLLLRGSVYTLSVDAKSGDVPQRVATSVNAMSCNAKDGRVVIASDGALQWFDLNSGQREPIVRFAETIDSINIGPDGTVYAKRRGADMHAWKSGRPVEGFPKPIGGDRPQRLGDYWYAYASHGTIKRYNSQLEPAPGVVLGGASGSFIGFLPESADLTLGRGMAVLQDGRFAVTGMEGIIQIAEWDDEQNKFRLVRRIGSAVDMQGLGLDQEGNIWTPLGAWRWNDTPDAPRTIGAPAAQDHAQPIALDGETICVLQQRHSNTFLATGPFIDEHGWSKYETDRLNGLKEVEQLRGAAVIPAEKGQLRMIVVKPDGAGYQIPLQSQGRLAGAPQPIQLGKLSNCTSLAYAQGKLFAASEGQVIAFAQNGDQPWQEIERWNQPAGNSTQPFGDTISIHSDGTQLAVSDTQRHRVLLLDPSSHRVIGQFGQLDQAGGSLETLHAPTHIAVQGNRVVVYDSANQRIVRLEQVSKFPTQSAAARVTLSPPSQTSFAESDFVDVSNLGGPRAAIALRREQGMLSISVRTEMSSPPAIELGVAGTKSMVLDSSSALIDENGFHFQVPISALVDSEEGWHEIRWGAALTWNGAGEQRERLGHVDHRATFRPLSTNPSDWAALSFAEYQRRVSEQRNEIWVEFEQPMDGKATIVVEDDQGNRIRNLIAGKATSAGKHRVAWDGLDERGRLVPPGKYHWRGVSHPGLKPDYLMNFANGDEPTFQPWGPNHSTIHDVTSNGKYVFFAAPVTEGGWALIALDAEGNWVQGYEHQHGLGINHDAIAADDRYLYCAQDGFTWGGTRGIDFKSDQWQSTWNLSLVRYDIKSGKMVDFPGKKRHLIIDEMQVGPGSKNAALEGYNLGGLAVHDGQIYVGSRQHNAVLVLDAESGKLMKKIPVQGPRMIAAADDVFVAADRGVIRLRDQKLIVPAANLDLAGIAIASNGDILVSDRHSHQIHRFDSAGKFVTKIGSPGGPYAGKYDPSRIVDPEGIDFGPDGKLWVTEDRWSPKRIHAWDLKKNQVVYEKFGVPHYGGTGAGFDPQSHRQWVGLGCRWELDFDKKSARPTHILAIDDAHFEHYHPLNYRIVREQGRTFLISFGKITIISEVHSDGSIQDCAALSDTHHFSYGCNWEPPQAYIDAYYERWPEDRKNERVGQKGDGKPYAQKGPGVLWIDRNNDGETQQEEFEFTDKSVNFGGSSWGHRQLGLSMKAPLVIDGQTKIATLAPSGFTNDGVPNYPTLAEAVANAADIALTPGHNRNNAASYDDRFGRFVINSDPEMNAYDASGKHLWSFANQWSGVHGSHKAPLPEPGVMQGTLFFLGMASFDDQADVFMLNGNHGRCFLMTSDGLYLDEMFSDVRISYVNNAYRLGGEIFGGYFGRSEENGQYYVQIGHGSYRLFGISGINQAVRISGELTVSKQQADAAEQKNLRLLVETKQDKHAVIAMAQTPPTIDGDLKDWKESPVVRWDQQGKFPVEMFGSWDEQNLYLAYRVEDGSPFVNEGRRWNTLFATGDSVDFQFAADPQANPRRNSPVPGDKRLMIAPFESKPTAVLYEHRKPDGQNPIEFTSPWRGEQVDNVEQLADAEIAVKKSRGGYSVEVKVPLAALGWKITPGTTYRGDFGVTFGDPTGHETQLRSYWANPSTMLVDDIPGEIMLHPIMWGEIEFVK